MEGPVANASTRLYYPLEANAENHVANTMDAPVLLFIFASGCAAILAATYVIAKRTRPTICHGGIAIAFWWVLCGFIHSFFEGSSPPSSFPFCVFYSSLPTCSLLVPPADEAKKKKKKATLPTTTPTSSEGPISSPSSGRSTRSRIRDT